MKSTDTELKNRGMASENDIFIMSNLTQPELILKLHDKEPHIRSAAAINLHSVVDEAADELLLQLSREKCLYTRIAICECLEKGNIDTAKKMTEYLGRIGENQHKVLPDKVSAKKSFPLPRDIIARSLGRMDVSIFPVLIEVLKSGETKRVREVLDAIGYMVFYNSVLATEENCEKVISLSCKYKSDKVIRWKMMLCLSAFPCETGNELLKKFEGEENILGLEARRSLKIIESRKTNNSQERVI